MKCKSYGVATYATLKMWHFYATHYKDIGEKIALENAKNKVWKLEGYLLAEDIYRSKQASSCADMPGLFVGQEYLS